MEAYPRPTYTEYENPHPGCYTIHIDIRCDNNKEAIAIKQQIVDLLTANGISVSLSYLTDADDWAEHIHHDDHPDAVRVGVGRRVVLNPDGTMQL